MPRRKPEKQDPYFDPGDPLWYKYCQKQVLGAIQYIFRHGLVHQKGVLPYEIGRKRVEMYLFLRRIFPLWFNSKLKKDSGFNQPYFPKNFFGFLQPGDLGHLLCLRRSQSEQKVNLHQFSNLIFPQIRRFLFIIILHILKVDFRYNFGN